MMRTFEVSLNGIVRGLAVVGGCVLSTSNGFAQDRPPFDRSQFMQMRSPDGRSFPMPPGSMPPGDFRGFDRGRDSDRDRDRRDSGERSSSSSYGSGGSGAPGGSSAAGSSTQAPHRITLDLQSSYSEVDANGDGQVGLYEWKKAKRPLAQFLQLDANGDGFLTPRELERAASMPMVATASPTTGVPAPGTTATIPSASPTTPPAMATTQPAAPAAAPVASRLSEEDQAKADEASAKSTFSILDRDHDGKLSAEEMARSSRIRPLFEQAGLKFDQPMPADQFVSHYVRIQKSKRT